MRLHNAHRAGAALLAAGLCFSLAACNQAEAPAAEPSAETENTEDSAQIVDDPYAYLADFVYGDYFDDNGYLKDTVASDYVTFSVDPNKLELPAGSDTVTEEELLDYIETEILPSFESVNQITDRPAAIGDTVNIDYSGTIDGVAFAGGTAQGYDLVLGSKNFIDDFEEQIAGHTPGETFTVTVTFPDPYTSADLAGKEAEFETTLNYIAEPFTPELTDEFVEENLSENFDLHTVEEMKSFVSDMMVDDKMYTATTSALSDAAEFSDEFPAALNEFMDHYLLYSPFKEAQYYGVTTEDLLSQYGFESVEAYAESMAENMDSAKKNLLIAQAVAELNNIVCDDAMLEAELDEIFGGEDYSSYVDMYGKNYMRMTIMQNKAYEAAMEKATVAK